MSTPARQRPTPAHPDAPAAKKPFRYDAFATLVAAHASSLNDQEIARHWQSFINPSVESTGRLFDAQQFVKASSGAEYSVAIEAIRFGPKGSVILKRDLTPQTGAYSYTLHLMVLKPRQAHQRPVRLATIATAIRAGVSLLPAALADDPEFLEVARKALMDPQQFSSYEKAVLGELIEDSKTPGKVPRHRL